MLSKETIIKDLNDICRQTNAEWLCALDIYTPNIKADEEKFLQAYRKVGLSKKYVIFRTEVALEYGGGLKFNYHKLYSGGYTLQPSGEYQSLVLLSGFETAFDQSTVYHECAHLYQRKHDFFGKSSVRNETYRKYLKEVHANVFATMALLLRSEDVLSFKKQQLYCLSEDIQRFNNNDKESKFYISLPIVFELIKAVRKQGRAKTLQKFSKNGNLDFQKIAFYTADLVRKYAYNQCEFEKILRGETFSSYEIIKQKAKAWHQMGRKYVEMQHEKTMERIDHYIEVKDKRQIEIDQKLKKLEETDEKAKIINAVCEIDTCHARLSQTFGIYTDLDYVVSNKIVDAYGSALSTDDKKQVSEICAQAGKIYQKWRKNVFFKRLYSKINHPDTRDEVWNMKFKKEKENFHQFTQTKGNGR